METISSTTKRKKRKTRKCLDEIRKKSRRSTDASDTFKKSPLLGKIGETVINLNGARLKNCMTTNRLTLAMFPKTIRSETITRPIMPELRQNPHKIAKGEGPQSTVTSSSLKNKELSYSDSDVIRNSDKESVKSVFDKCNMGIRRDSGSENLSNRGVSPGSFILFSPMIHSAETDDIFDESPNGETISTLTSTSQSSREGYGHHLYEELMNEIPTYLKEMAPALIKDDVMKKTRTLLHNIYMEGCHDECKDNTSQCIKNSVVTQQRPLSPRVSISQNSIDDIKVGYSWRQSVAQKLRGSVGVAGTGVGSDSAPARSLIPGHSLVYDTPEYTYYPHKLNQ